MIKKILPVFFCLLSASSSLAQDSALLVGKKIITLSEVVVNNKLNVPAFIDRIKNDTTFYKAFRNLRILNYVSINDIRMLNKDGNSQASLYSKIKQIRKKVTQRLNK